MSVFERLLSGLQEVLSWGLDPESFISKPYIWALVGFGHAWLGRLFAMLLAVIANRFKKNVKESLSLPLLVTAIYFFIFEFYLQNFGAGIADSLVDAFFVLSGALTVWAVHSKRYFFVWTPTILIMIAILWVAGG